MTKIVTGLATAVGTKADSAAMRDQPNRKRARIPENQATLRKRAPIRAPTLVTDIYVTNSSSYKGQLSRAKKLLVEDGHPFIVLHGIGAAIERTISLAMGISAVCSQQVRCQTETGTVDLVDDVVPKDQEEDIETSQRQNSAVHILIEMLQPMPSTSRELAQLSNARGGRRRNI